MKKQLVIGAMAAALAFGTQSALADSAKTLGGIVIESDDGNFLASLGGRIHFDYTGIMPDKDSKFGSAAAENDSGFYFRRVFISLSGKLYGWRYRVDEDIANGSNPASGFQDVFISHEFFTSATGTTTLKIGQSKPFRSMDELTSNNEIEFMSRNYVSSVALLGGRDYQDGLFYYGNKKGLLLPTSNLQGGISVYSLSKAGNTTAGSSANAPTQGIGLNARVAFAPIVTPKAWLHVGANYSSDHADNHSTLTANSSDYYSYKGVTQTLISFTGTGTTGATSGQTAQNVAGGDNPSATTMIGELAGAFGPGFFQGEIGESKFRQHAAAAGSNVQTAVAYSATGAVYLTGETKRYNTETATYSSAKPIHKFGAVELAARYDFIRNRDLPTDDTTVCKGTFAPAIPKGDFITKCDVSLITVGVNYYVNPAVRLMLDYEHGKVDLGYAEDKPNALNARFQIAF